MKKITHICLCGPVTDNWSYQDNLLPKYHKKIGYEVSVITSQYIWNEKGNLDIDRRSTYYNEYGIKTIRLESKYGSTVQSKFKRYKNLYETICKEEPDILFVHGVQFLDIKDVVKYLKQNSTIKVYVDNHADFSNSATNWLSKKILHGIIWKRCGEIIEPYTSKFYGVLPARVNFLKDVYKLPEKKIELLVLGADDEKVNDSNRNTTNNEIREKFLIKPDDFLIITGGKIDTAKKQTLLLMKAVKEIEKSNVKLIIFGSVSNEMNDEFNTLIDGEKIIYTGWISTDDSYKYFSSADLAVFSGRHSVLWEQAVGTGLPCIFKYWKGTTHVDVGGNCKFLYNDSVDEIKKSINEILNDRSLYISMKKSAEVFGMNRFSYENIAKQSLQDK
ncbi:glycosyltransferase family 4 protein [Bacillus sp. V3B]|uniref:glycosyltransferase family 4 protein n=1 Tax=Bacillus sp. V3B TaxID=2804915 RepID=UPI00210A3B77|nr:glycosyltransferase family 4 protein [Bacillus sp. V3B]MCQ6274675.1 glycosyltransferase family 4 protein [Bacillus sp. V3B]